MRLVLDASVAVKWLLTEAGFEQAEDVIIRARAGIDELIAPDLFLAECGHALFRAERKKAIVPGEARRLISILIHDLPALHASHVLVSRAAAICQHLRKSFLRLPLHGSGRARANPVHHRRHEARHSRSGGLSVCR